MERAEDRDVPTTSYVCRVSVSCEAVCALPAYDVHLELLLLDTQHRLVAFQGEREKKDEEM